jgi:hypothetical protein
MLGNEGPVAGEQLRGGMAAPVSFREEKIDRSFAEIVFDTAVTSPVRSPRPSVGKREWHRARTLVAGA